MKAVYKAKVDTWLFVLISVLPLVIIWSTSSSRETIPWEAVGIVVGTIIIILFLISSIRYEIDGTTLIVWMCPFVRQKVDIMKIRRIRKTHSILSAPAPSLDRIALELDRFDEIIISPKEKWSFIEHLLQINHDIEVKVK